MSELKEIIKVTKSQMELLKSGGSIGDHTLRDDVLYAVEREEDESVEGADGLSIYKSSYSASTGTTTININTITVPEDRKLQVGDLIIAGTDSYLFRITAVNIDAGTVTVTYLITLKGNPGSPGSAGAAASISTGSATVINNDDIGTITNLSPTYSFIKQSSGYFESNNNMKKANNSWVLCRLTFNNTVENGSVVIDYISNGESAHDYGIFGNIDQTLNNSNTDDGATGSTKVKHNCKNEASSIVKTITYTNITVGLHFIDIKYIKDGSVDTTPDTLQFKLNSNSTCITDLQINDIAVQVVSSGTSTNRTLDFIFQGLTSTLVYNGTDTTYASVNNVVSLDTNNFNRYPKISDTFIKLMVGTYTYIAIMEVTAIENSTVTCKCIYNKQISGSNGSNGYSGYGVAYVTVDPTTIQYNTAFTDINNITWYTPYYTNYNYKIANLIIKSDTGTIYYYNSGKAGNFKYESTGKSIFGTKGDSAGFADPEIEVSTLDAGQSATASIDASGTDKAKKFKFTFGIPKGEKGADSTIPGPAAGFDTPSATVTTLPAGSAAQVSVSASGENTNKKFKFTFGIPKGEKGDKGDATVFSVRDTTLYITT